MVFVDQLPSGQSGFLLLASAVHVYLRAGAARAGIAHFPKVIVLVAVQDMVGRQVLCPDRSRLLVTSQPLFGCALKDGGIEVLRVDVQHIHDVFPRKVDGSFLEVITKRPVAQHLEHGVVIGIVPHLFQVVVLAADTQTLL